MSRPVKYRRNVFIFRLPSDEPIFRQEDRVIMESNEFCEECRKPLTKEQIYRGFKCCSYKCSNRRKARKFKGRHFKRNNMLNLY